MDSQVVVNLSPSLYTMTSPELSIVVVLSDEIKEDELTSGHIKKSKKTRQK